MNTNSDRISARAQRSVSVACLLLLLLVGLGCGDESGETVSAQYSPDSDFTLTHPSGAEVAIPAGARATGLKIIATVPPPTRRPGAAVTVVGGGITLSPTNPGLTMPATVTLPITPSMIPAGASVIIVQGRVAGFVPLPTRRTGNAVVATTVTFGDFFPVVMAPADGGMPPMDIGATDVGTHDAGAADAGNAEAAVDDAAVEDIAVDAGPYCGDGIRQEATEQCDNGDLNHATCNFAGDCTFDCLYCLE